MPCMSVARFAPSESSAPDFAERLEHAAIDLLQIDAPAQIDEAPCTGHARCARATIASTALGPTPFSAPKP